MAPDQGINHPDLSSFIQNTAMEPIAFGGFSDIYIGDLIGSHTSRKAVIKVLRAHTNCKDDILRAKKRLNREVAIIGKLNHPNIAEYFGISFHLGYRPAIVMAWYAHGDAASYLENRPKTERLHLIKGLIDGLCYLHSRSPAVVHGDIKGANVLVSDSREGVLSDFGLSKVAEDTLRPSGNTTSDINMSGTIRWMAPELLQDESGSSYIVGPTLSSDIWAFGCTFYELLAGKVPYSSRKYTWSVINDIMCGRHPFSEVDAAQVGSDKMWRVIRECWSPAPGHRPTIFEVKDKLSTLWD